MKTSLSLHRMCDIYLIYKWVVLWWDEIWFVGQFFRRKGTVRLKKMVSWLFTSIMGSHKIAFNNFFEKSTLNFFASGNRERKLRNVLERFEGRVTWEERALTEVTTKGRHQRSPRKGATRGRHERAPRSHVEGRFQTLPFAVPPFHQLTLP